MGNVIRRCFGEFSSADEGGQYPGQYPSQYPGQYPGQYPSPYQGQYGTPGGAPAGYAPGLPPVVAVDSAGFSQLARDLLQFETTNKVPDALSQYVKATKVTQVTWYKKLLVAWKIARPPPATAEEASAFLLRTLQGHHNVHVQGLLRFYGLPVHTTFVAGGTWPQGVQYEIHTLPVDDRAVGDGDTITVFVDVHRDAREAATAPAGVLDAAHRRQAARAQHNYGHADALQKQIQQAGYKVFDGKDGGIQCVAKKYRVRLKGVDAPEITQPYGQESKACLNSLVRGHPLLVHVYNVDNYGRLVGDIYCNGMFIQEALLKKGCVWHYTQYDKRPTFTKWEAEAKASCVGLWAVVNPERPWEYRKGKRDARKS